MGNEVVVALAKKYAATPAQIVLAFLTGEGVAVIPKSTDPEHIRTNLKAVDLSLDPDDVAAMRALDTGVRSFRDPDCHGFC